MPPNVMNLFADLADSSSEELASDLFRSPSLRIERIASYGQASPSGYWYDQEQPEWVLLLRGTAELAFDDGRRLDLNAGDYLYLAARRRHRVEGTSPDAVWLAVHFSEATDCA